MGDIGRGNRAKCRSGRGNSATEGKSFITETLIFFLIIQGGPPRTTSVDCGKTMIRKKSENLALY